MREDEREDEREKMRERRGKKRREERKRHERREKMRIEEWSDGKKQWWEEVMEKQEKVRGRGKRIEIKQNREKWKKWTK